MEKSLGLLRKENIKLQDCFDKKERKFLGNVRSIEEHRQNEVEYTIKMRQDLAQEKKTL